MELKLKLFLMSIFLVVCGIKTAKAESFEDWATSSNSNPYINICDGPMAEYAKKMVGSDCYEGDAILMCCTRNVDHQAMKDCGAVKVKSFRACNEMQGAMGIRVHPPIVIDPLRHPNTQTWREHWCANNCWDRYLAPLRGEHKPPRHEQCSDMYCPF